MGNKCSGVTIIRADGRPVCGCVVEKLGLIPFDQSKVDYVYYGEDSKGQKLMGKLHNDIDISGDLELFEGVKLWMEHGRKGFEKSWSKVGVPSRYPEVLEKVQQYMAGSYKEKFTSDDELFINDIAAYKGMFEHTKRGAGHSSNKYDGACACGAYVGSAEHSATSSLRDYKGSAMSAAKERLIDVCVAAMNDLKIKIVGDTPEEKVKSLLLALPKGDDFKSNVQVHTTTCRAIAGAINKNVGEQVISITLPAELICQQVAEYLKSLSHSVTNEFHEVLADVSGVVDNLQMLKVALKAMGDELVSDSQDSVNQAKARKLKELHTVLTDEVTRQLAMLKNLLNITLDPTSRKLAELARSNKDLDAVISGTIAPGSSKFGDVMARVLRGVGTTAYEAIVVDAALKTIGMTVDEYAAIHSIDSLKSKVLAAGLKDMNDEQLNKYIKAVKTLSETLNKSSEIVDAIKARKGADEGVNVDYYEEDNVDNFTDNEVTGGADNYPPNRIERQVSNKRKLRNIIFSAFYKQVNDAFDKFIMTLNIISGKIGKEIPLSEQLDGFRSILHKIKLREGFTRKSEIFYALVGYFNDALSKSKKEMFTMDMRMVINFIDTMMEDPIYAGSKQYFGDLKHTINNVLDIINRYSDEIQQKFGGEEIVGAAECDKDDDFKPESLKWKNKKTMDDALMEFDYRYRVVQIKANLNHSAKDLALYGENYEKMTAMAIANYVQVKDDELAWDKKKVSEAATAAKSPIGDAALDAIIKFVDSQRESRKKFWSTVEAVDMYMRYFTNAIVTNPDDVKDIKAMLNDIEVISDWYSEATGDNLAGIFDKFSNSTQGGKFEKEPAAPEGSHYYQKIQNVVAKAPGNPSIEMDAGNAGCTVKADIKKVFGGLTALKNLLSVFVHVGAKFGGVELTKKVFMTPAQMYNNLIDFIAASSMSSYNGDIVNPGFIMSTHSADVEKYKHNWAEEKLHFVMVIKAICAKIFTVVGTYDILDRPHEFNGFNPIRMILGGSDALPKVDSACIPLYVRLPLLCQFYRELFGDKPDDTPASVHNRNMPYKEVPINNNNLLKIAMIPDLDGTFSGIIRLIFRKTKNVTDNVYSDNEMIEIIKECNLIYQKSLPKHPKNTILEIINDLVAEVNRRYGIVSNATNETYESQFGDKWKYSEADYTTDNDLGAQYALLPGEGEEDVVRPGPSQKLLLSSYSEKPAYDSPFNITHNYANLIKSFRCKLDTEFASKISEPGNAYNFNAMIKSTQMKLAGESNDEVRFRLVCDLVKSDGVYNRSDSHKHLMFHETVISGLNLLSAVHSMLARFQKRAAVLDIDTIVKLLSELTPTELSGATDADKIKVLVFAKFALMKYCNDDDVLYGNMMEEIFKPVNGALSTADIKKENIHAKLNMPFMMNELLESVYGLSNDLQGLVEVRLDAGKLYLSYDKLKTEIECMFDCVTKSIELLRPHVDDALITQYTAKYNPGSLFWLQEQLMEKIINASDRDNKPNYVSIDNQMRKLSSTFNYLMDKDINSADLFRSMIVCDVDATSVYEVNKTNVYEPIAINKNLYEKLHAQGNTNSKTFDLDHSCRIKALYDFDDKLNLNRSCVFAFNQLIAKFIYGFYDTASQKMYGGLITTFANGTFSNAVSNVDYTFKDTTSGNVKDSSSVTKSGVVKFDDTPNLKIEKPADDATNTAAGAVMTRSMKDKAGVEAPANVLYTSLAIILRTITSTRNVANQNLVNLFENIADIPEYLKEKMRANLPAFRNLFDELRCRCEYIKTMMNTPKMKCSKASEHSTTLDAIIRGCVTLRTACETSMKEIGVDVKYFEMYKGSIKEYKSLYGVDPLMPLSSVLYILRNSDANNDNDFLPVHSLGEPKFKFMYGTTDILQEMRKNHLLENNIGFKNCMDNFNALSTSKFQYAKGDAENYLKSFTKLSRWVYNVKHIKGMLTPYIGFTPVIVTADIANKASKLNYISGMFTRDDLIVTHMQHGGASARDLSVSSKSIYKNGIATITNNSDVSMVYDDGNVDYKAARAAFPHVGEQKEGQSLKPVYSAVKPQAMTLQLIENSKRNDSIDKIMEYLLDAKSENKNRKTIQNIIDLNIVPINIHALMREIPLANLYNYSYTFDRLITELYYGCGSDKLAKLCGDITDPQNALDALVGSMLDPYHNNANAMQHVSNMLLGLPLAGELGRPKFLSDQVYGKVIFGDMLATLYDDDVTKGMGPLNGSSPTKKVVKEALEDIIKGLWKNIISNVVMKQRFNDISADIDIIAKIGAEAVVNNRHITTGELQKLLSADLTPPTGTSTASEKIIQSAALFVKLVSVVALYLNGDDPSAGDRSSIGYLFKYPGKDITESTDMSKFAGYLRLIKSEITDALVGIAIASTDATFDLKTIVTAPWKASVNVQTLSVSQPRDTLHWYSDQKNIKDNKVESRVFDRQMSAYLQICGQARYDTDLIRNIIFVINAYRSVRLKLQRDLTYSRDVIRSSVPVTANELTEFIGFQRQQSLTGRRLQ